jgi:hypothetical protein
VEPGWPSHGARRDRWECVQDLLDSVDPLEFDQQAAHLFKHPHLGLDDVMDAWTSDPLVDPARPPAHRLVVAKVTGTGTKRTSAGADPLAVTQHPSYWLARTGGTDEY